MVAEVVHSLISANGQLRVDVVRRRTGGYQLAYARFRRENVPEYGWVWEGWVPAQGSVILTDDPERGKALAAEELALWERTDFDPF